MLTDVDAASISRRMSRPELNDRPRFTQFVEVPRMNFCPPKRIDAHQQNHVDLIDRRHVSRVAGLNTRPDLQPPSRISCSERSTCSVAFRVEGDVGRAAASINVRLDPRPQVRVDRRGNAVRATRRPSADGQVGPRSGCPRPEVKTKSPAAERLVHFLAERRGEVGEIDGQLRGLHDARHLRLNHDGAH